MKLISITDFIININKICPKENMEVIEWWGKKLDVIENYAKFLKQPLKLEMFMPCYFRDGITIPYTNDILITSMELFKEYEEAKERVLFEGFENSTIDELKIMFKTCKLNIIEDFLNYKEEIQLTENVVKQIGI